MLQTQAGAELRITEFGKTERRYLTSSMTAARIVLFSAARAAKKRGHDVNVMRVAGGDNVTIHAWDGQRLSLHASARRF